MDLSLDSREASLLGLAPELLELVLCNLVPHDLVRFGRTCRRAHAFIHPSNHILWRSAFLHEFDDPNDAWEPLPPTARAENRQRESTWDWYQETHRRMDVFNIVYGCVRPLDPHYIVTTLLGVLETASYSPTSTYPGDSKNLEFLNELLRVTPTFERIVHDYHRDKDSVSLPADLMTGDYIPVRQMLLERNTIPEWASRFHVFYGMTQREEESWRAKMCARATVYDWAATSPEADFGPFVKDGSGTVNWQTLEAISSLMHRAFETMRKGHRLYTCSGFGPNVPFALPTNPEHPEDWAGVTRTWVATYAFLDYRALVHYNFATDLEYHMDLGAYEEACGDLMKLELELDTSEKLSSDPRLQSDLPYCDDLPKLFFNGSNRDGGPIIRPHIHVRGCAWLAPGARQVRWRFIINYAGADQWQLEGVQPAGIRSGNIYGLWSHVDHDDQGPTGPFSYFPLEFCEPVESG